MSQVGDDIPARDVAEAVARRSYGKLVAFLAMRTRDVAAAEDVLAEAFAIALESWPKNGCPSNPEAWLLTVARRRMVDLSRNTQRHETAVNDIRLLSEGLEQAAGEPELPDHRLALMFAAAHPAIEERIRAPLILQVVLGLSAETIASVFLAAPATMGKRLVRAKEKIKQAGIPFTVPERAQLPARLDTVLDAIYAAFGAGWEDPIGTDAMRGELTSEALFLARLVTELMPTEPEALGLAALILHSHARRGARRDASGDYVPFDEQDAGEWDHDMIGEAEAALSRAAALPTTGRAAFGRYQLEAAVQSAHVHRHRTGRFNWPEIVQLYDALSALTGSPVIAINKALAIAEISGAGTGLAALPEPGSDSRLAEYQPYWAARAELLARTGMHAEARQAYDIAIGLERDEAVRRFLRKRQARVASSE